MLTESENQAYVLLGIVASLAGHRELIFNVKRKKKSADGRIGAPMTRWTADTIPEDLLSEMRCFRDKLFHGLCIVFEDGSIEISDESLKEDDPDQTKKWSFVELSTMVDKWVEWLVPSVVMERYEAAGYPSPIRIRTIFPSPKDE